MSNLCNNAGQPIKLRLTRCEERGQPWIEPKRIEIRDGAALVQCCSIEASVETLMKSVAAVHLACSLVSFNASSYWCAWSGIPWLIQLSTEQEIALIGCRMARVLTLLSPSRFAKCQAISCCVTHGVFPEWEAC